MKAVVIGAGIVGVTAALTLAEADIDVLMLDRGQIAGEASGLNAGIIGGGGWVGAAVGSSSSSLACEAALKA